MIKNRCLLVGVICASVVLLLIVKAIVKSFLLARRLPKWWNRKRVLLTGASTGIGEQIAYILAKFDCDYIITARRKKELDDVARKCNEIIKAQGGQGRCISLVADQSKEENIHRAVDFTLKELGGLDVLLLNAAETYFRPFDTLNSRESLDLAHLIMNTNYFAMLTYYRDLLPELRRTQGTMLIVSSLSGRSGSPFSPFYSASKAALNAFVEGVSQEREDGVNLCVALPGTVATQICLDNIGQKFYDSGMAADLCARKILETPVKRKQFSILPIEGYVQQPLNMLAPKLYRLASKMVLPSYDEIMQVHPQWSNQIPDLNAVSTGSNKKVE
ncbi:MAG: putative NAD-dependent ADP-ribosyltransferase sirtuin-4 [Streblomastix strix]|uniref:Putative NAD-dependent ADP-ribosyltransferase sirtuin-4 n=1 Tax=Streblomastix strix TaxID=222440 RepID=A0A5J4VW65_9EUKA|nr:MAG: putative NAD-dependent ADP-ribosyltransferase sirtuin-4 [Streblomastix strix]